MYSLILGGGLGNQMFQYAYARYLMLEYNINFNFNLYEYNVHSNEIETRKFSLSEFNIINNGNFQKREESIKDFKKFNRTKKINRIIGKFISEEKCCQILADLGCICSVSNPYTFYNIEIKKKDGIIHGGFQSEKFFLKHADKIKEELKVKKEVAEKNKKIYEEIKNSNSVAVHIRRGDYLNPKFKHLNICNEEYYRKGIEYFMNLDKNFKFFVFSNNHEEVQWIKENYLFLPKGTIFVDNDNMDYEDLQLMYNCKNFVISNSTFSWWAQYLSNNAEKIVIAPGIWNKDLINESKEIYQENWKIIK
ncbi:MAG: alpha-1,2-fucosyltransferase [Clostridia bacterium]|nr:alpha-1,2-fucosyltransferase [Clostridia bacterium]